MNAFLSRLHHPLAACAILLLLLAPLPAVAEEEVLFASHTHVMGDNETRNQARTIAMTEAKRKILEQAGTYVESLTRVENFALSSDEVTAFSAAFLRVTVENEAWSMLGDTLQVTVELSARVDPDELKPMIEQLARDANARARLAETMEQEREAEDRLVEESDPETRARLSEDMAVLEAERRRILEDMALSTRLAAELVEKNMTMDEVERMLGSPRAVKEHEAASGAYQCWNYGDAWVVFRDGLAACVRTRLEYRNELGSDCHCTGLSMNFLMR